MTEESGAKSKSFPWHVLLRWLARLVTVCLLVWVAWTQDWRALGSILTSGRGILYLLISIGSMLLGQACASLRWLLLLRVENPDFSFARAFKITLIGAFASLFLPTTAGGDLVRIVSLDDRDKAASVSVVAMDRIISVFSMVFLVPVSLVILIPYLRNPQIGLAVGFLAMLAALEPTRMRRFFQPILSFLKKLKNDLLSWRNHPARMAAAILLALGSNGFSWAAVWFLAKGLDIQAGYWQVVAAGVWIYAAGLLPIAINGLGVQEASYVYLYGLISSVPASLAATLGILTRLIYILAVLPGGIWLAFSPEIRRFLKRPNQE